jgi:hypothetical protein
MRKQAAPRTRQHRQVSSPEQLGLIVQGETAQQSATRQAALDNRSHRTTPHKLQAQALLGKPVLSRIWCLSLKQTDGRGVSAS